jgi:copper transport protein
VLGPGFWLVAALRWVQFAALAAAVGGIAGRALARDHAGPAPAPLPGPWALRASLLGTAASAGLAGDVAAHASLTHTGDGVIALIELAAFALAAVLLRLRRPGLSLLPLYTVIGAEGVRAHPETIVPVGGALLTWCHLVPAALWAGMLCYSVRAALAWRADPVAVRRLIGLYARAAGWLFATVVVTGLVSALVLVPVGSLLTTTYGRVLIIKAVLVAVAAALAVAGRRWLRREPEPEPGPGPGPGPGLALATRLEVATLAAVLAATAVLTALAPVRTP